MKIKMTVGKSGDLHRARVFLVVDVGQVKLSEVTSVHKAEAIVQARYAALETISGLVAELQEVAPKKG
jgi:hypothetical protein